MWVAERRAAWRCFRAGAVALALRTNSADAQTDSVRQADYPLADLSWSVRSLRGERQTLEAFRGRVIIINSWATWCEPCVAELKSLESLRAAVPDSALVFALVAAQQQAPVSAFVRRRALRLPVYLEMSGAPPVYRFAAVPTTWIVDRDGRIVFRRRGAMRWDTPEIRALIEGLLRNPSAPRP